MTSDAITHRNVKYRLLPGSEATALQLLRLRDACRFTGNETREARELQYSHACGRSVEAPTFFTFGNAFKALRDREPWLQEHSYSVLRYTLKHQADAWKAFFDGRAGYPKWKSRHGAPGFTIPDNVRVRDGKLAVPKVGWLHLRRHGGNPYPDGRSVQAVVKREGTRWYATVCYAIPEPPREHNGYAMGIGVLDRNRHCYLAAPGCRLGHRRTSPGSRENHSGWYSRPAELPYCSLSGGHGYFS